MSTYTEQLVSNLDTTPKTIFDLMENYGGWDSSPACFEMKRLVDAGIAKYYSKGRRFQDHYFVTCDDDETYQNAVEQVLSFTKKEN